MSGPRHAPRALTPERHAEVAEAFAAVVDLGPAEQRAHLDRLAERDAALAQEVESLLAYDALPEPVADRLLPPVALLDVSGTQSSLTGDGVDPAARPRQHSGSPQTHDISRAACPAAGTVIAGRYRIGAAIGSGGGGTVCRARDLEKNIDVAVKFLRADRVRSERGLRRFRAEFRAVARLDHPGCTQAFAEGADGDWRYIVMEYVSGGDLDSLAGAPTDLVLAVLVQVAVALDYMHSRRIVHRDLKPGNILLVPGNPPAPRIADFGIALLEDETARQPHASGLVGTVDYLSPEQVEGKPADPRSDLYALGCMIFRLWAGRPPFVGPGYARLAARCREKAPRLRELVPTAPEGLDELAAQLLATNPVDRPQSALAVADVLARVLVATGSPLASRLLASTSLSAQGAFLYAPGLIGRDAELARLVTQARAMSAGAPTEPLFFAVCAEGGMGKSTLCQAAQQTLAVEGFRTISVSVPASSAEPLAPFPELRMVLGDGTTKPAHAHEPRRLADDGSSGLRQEAAALVERLQSAHAATPLVVVLEDLHQAEGGSARLLVEIARRLTEKPGPRPVLIATLRPEGRTALVEAAASQTGAPGEPANQVCWIDLDRLDATGAAGIAAAMMGVRVPQLPAGLVELLLLESDGSPLLIHSALRALVDGGALQRTGGGWALDAARTEAHATGQALVDRLAGIAAPTRRILEVAAAVGRRFDAELIAATLGEDEDVVQDALDDASRAGVIRPVRTQRQRDLFEFDHARLAEVLHDTMNASARTICHAKLGRVLADRQGSSVVLARHYALGGDPLSAARSLRFAGDEALQQFDHSGAAALFREALSQCESLPTRAEVEALREACREGLADALVVAGPAKEAVTLLVALLETDRSRGGAQRPPAESWSRARRLRKLGYARMRSGDMAGTISAFEASLATVRDGLPRTRGGLLLRGLRDFSAVALRRIFRVAPAGAGEEPGIEEAAVVHRELGQLYRWIDLERSLAHHVASARAAERVGSAELRVSAYSWVAASLALASNDTASLALDRLAGDIARAASDRTGLARLSLLRAGVDFLVRNDFPRGLARFDEGVRLAQTTGDPVLHAWALAWRGWLYVFACRMEAARADLLRAHAVGVDLGIDWLIADTASALGIVDCVEGRLDAAVAGARALLASETRLALPAIEALGTELLGATAFLRAEYREAAAQLARARTIYERHHLERGWGYLVELEETDSLLCLTDSEGAAAVPDLLARIRNNRRSYARRLRRIPLYRGCVEMMRGILEARTGRHQRARRTFARVLAARAGRRETYVDAWMLWRTAFERRRMGDPLGELLPYLDEVEEIFDRLKIDGFRQWLAGARKIYAM